MKHYVGKILEVTYPEFLEVEKTEPNWLGVSSDDATTVTIEVDPEPGAAEGFSNLIRNPYFAKSAGVKIDREGYFRLGNGLEGYERVARLTDAVGRVQTFGWLIDGKLNNHILNVQITTVERDWHDGLIWRVLITSIKVVN